MTVSTPITKAQIKAIHVALHKQGIDDETYREMLDNEYGVSSCKALDRRQAHQLLNRLKVALTKPAKPRTRRPIQNPAAPVANDDDVVYLATPKQNQLIYELIQEVAWDHADGYQRWLKTCLGLSKVRSRNDASRVIQGLRGLKKGGHAKLRIHTDDNRRGASNE